MTYQSVTAYIAGAIWSKCKRWGSESFFVGLILRFFDGVQNAVTESGIYAWLGADLFYEKKCSSSVFYFLLNKALKFLCDIAAGVKSAVRKAAAGSVTLLLLNRASVVTIDKVLPVFIGIMLMAPHEAWNNLYAVLAALVFALWAISERAKNYRDSETGINLPLAVFFIAIISSTVSAIVFSDALRISLFLIASLLLAIAAAAAIDTREKLLCCLKTVLVFVSFTGLYAIAQRISGVEVDLEFVDTTANEGMPGRVYSVFSNPNNFAEILILFLPFFVPVFLETKGKQKAAVAGGFAVCVAALAMTYSRSCWVGFALGAVLFVMLYNKKLLIPFALLCLIAIPFLPETIINRIFTIGSMSDSSNSYRIYIWTSCLRMIKDFGLTGLGLGPASFKTVYPDYAASVAITAPHSHMLYMELILEMGVLGFFGFLWIMYYTVKKTAGAMRRMDKFTRTVAVSGLSALLGIAFVCCAEYVWFYPRVMFAFWLVPAICMSTVNIAKK